MLVIPVAELVSCEVDWFQLSWPKGQEGSYGPFYWEEQCRLRDTGLVFRFDRRSQYVGASVGGLFAGSGGQGGFCEASGAVALACLQMAKKVKGDGKCSRIDLQATIRLDRADEQVAANCIAATLAKAKAGVRGVPVKCPIIGQDGAGWTAYLGAPSSDIRFRIYDKGAQMGDCEVGVYWRFECQYRRRYAQKVYSVLRGLDTHIGFIASTLRGKLGTFGIDLALGGFEPSQVEFGRKPETGDQAAISWLRKAVSPSISRLLASAERAEARRLIFTWAAEAGLIDGELERW